jgi:8-oxo-dGTP pyrophosphatase MutT (NUDIX family)
MNSEHKNPWTILSSVKAYDNPWIQVVEHQVINPAGGKGIYGKVHFKNKALGIIPIDEHNNTWLVGQYRFPLNAYSWEIPEGGGPHDMSPLESAKRELKEETGIIAHQWELIMRIHTSNSVTDEEGLIYIAENLEHSEHDREETEADMVIRKIKLEEAINMVMQGEITDSLSIAGLLKVARLKGI